MNRVMLPGSSAAEPGRPLVGAVGLQRIVVEKTVPAQRHPDRPVVEGPLQDVDVLRVPAQENIR